MAEGESSCFFTSIEVLGGGAGILGAALAVCLGDDVALHRHVGLKLDEAQRRRVCGAGPGMTAMLATEVL